MHDDPSHSGNKLLMAGNPAGYQHPRAALLFGLLYLGTQAGADGHAESVVIRLVAETACHTTALDRRSGNVKSGGAQHVDGLRCGGAGPLLAVRVVEEPGTEARLGGGKEFRKIDTGFLGDVPQGLKRLKATGCERSDRSRVVQQVLVVKTQHGKHAGLDDDDLAATP